MKPRNIAIACGVAGVAVGLAAATGIVYHKQIKSAASLKRLTGYADGYDLYAIDIAYDYDLDRIIAADVRDDQPTSMPWWRRCCPVCRHMSSAPVCLQRFCRRRCRRRVRTGRNYDFKDDTSALLVRNHPRGGYASIGFAALNNLGDNTPLDSVAGRAAALMGPFAQLDGVNECGVSIAVLTLDSKPCDQDTQRPVINTSLAIRLVLDRAATTQEAVDLLSAYDMHAMAGRDYHFFINDAAGDARVVEWDPRDPDRAFKATPVTQVTNFYACYGDEVLPNQKNGELGHGKERAAAIADVLDAHTGAQDEAVAWKALRAAAQEPNPEDITSNTQWSVVFDNTEPAAAITLRRHWGDIDAFAL